MTLDIGTELYGFEVTRKRENKKLGGTLYEMIHRKTGAELCYVDNKNENKLFSVAFRTIPENSTGVFHILEHSVLCGSEKYPLKDPFVELLKSSMNTFLNAMTYPDKTVYPVSSRNEQDYLNLTSIYLDAVFAPKLLENPSVFRQEGWRLEKDEDGNYGYNGVVLSEMKGAMSDINSVMEQETDSLLFDETCYKYNSGGAPENITDLTYEQYADTYRSFYHPSNARFFLDGSVPLEKTLEMISGYLEKYEKKEVTTFVKEQTPHKACKTVYFESDGETGNRDNICFSKILGRYDELLKITGARILCDLLASTNDSPLKNAVISSGLAENFDLGVTDGIYQPYITATVRNCSAESLDKIKNIICEVIKNLEIKPEDLTASLNKLEFSYRRVSEPQGLEHNISALDSWLYGGDPILFFELDKVFSQLRELIGGNFYKELLCEIFSEENVATLIMKPDAEFAEKAFASENEKLSRALNSMSEEDKIKIQQEIEALEKWQNTPNTPEELALIPTLDINSLDKEPKHFVTNETLQGKVRVLRHPIETNGIAYISLYFPVTDFSFEEYSYLAVLTDVLSELPTKDYCVSELQREIKTNIGSLGFDMSVFAGDGETESCTPCLTASIGVLRENISKAAGLASQILVSTDFSDKEKIRNIILQVAQDNREYCVASGHIIGATAVRSAYTSKGAFKEAVDGISFMKTVSRIASDFDNEYNKLRAVFEKAVRFVGTENMILSITSDEEIDAEEITAFFPDGEKAGESVSLRSPLSDKTALKIPAPVSYAAKGWHQSLSDKEPHGSLRVVSNIVTLAYLWNEVRVLGGAYGAGMSGGANDGIFCYSYRDPSPLSSVNAYDAAADFLTEFAHSGESLDNFIISAVASGDPLLTPDAEGSAADNFYLCKITEETRKKNYSEMLGTDCDTLLSWAKTMRDMAQNGAVCVVGGESLLAGCDGFDIIDIS